MKTIGLNRQRRYPENRFAFHGVLWIVLLLTGLSSASLAAIRNVQDREITRAIENEIRGDSVIPSDQIDVETREGIVTFTGWVDNILAKERAQNIAESIVGVRAILNRINVVPAFDLEDGEIREAVEEALFDDPATDSYEVAVKVEDGVVTLAGKVDSWQEKQLCSTVAKGVKGVKEIKNKITIDFSTGRSDSEIEEEVKAHLANDVLVDDALIQVAVRDGKVRLSGTVGSLAEKNQAFSDAWVRGVESVNTDGLEIEWWARDEMRRKKLYISRTDQEIEEAVKDAIRYDPRVFSFNPEVDVRDGKVFLSGVVTDLAAKKAAEQAAKSTLGVQRVINNLKVRPETIRSNDELESRVSHALLADPHVERFKLDVSVYAGRVYLSGDVNTSWEKRHAEHITESVKGVVNVVNNIDYEYKWNWKPDWQIREDVKDQLFWSPYVDEEQVNITVDEGEVVLSGKVETWRERQAAEENAYQAGAKDVENNLIVRYGNFGPSFLNPAYP